MRPQAMQAASDLLWDYWLSGRQLTQGLPDDIRPQTRQQGYAIQALLERRTRAPLFGWKIAATSQAGQRHIGVDGPMAGRILAERVFAADTEVPFGANFMRVAEAEFAFRMKRGLAVRDARYSIDEVCDAVEALYPAIEIPDSRYQNFAAAGAPQLIADSACAHYFVLGPPTSTDWRCMNLGEHKVVGSVKGRLEHTGSGASVLGDPRIALTWLANELVQVGSPLQAGQVVTTGTCTVPLPVAPGDEVVNDMGILGRVSFRFGSL